VAKRILLLGANDRACFSVAKNLTRHGYVIGVASWEWHPLKYSRYVQAFYILPDLKTGMHHFYEAFQKLIAANNYWLVLPINDMAVEFLFHYKDQLEKNIIVGGINSQSAIKYSRDKYELWKICRELKMHVPSTMLVSSLGDFDKIKQDLHFPVIAKPVSSKKIHENKIYSYTVKRLKTQNAVEEFIRERITVIPILLQEPVEGFGIGFNFLARNGDVIAFYMHERIHEPTGGGESSYRKTLIDDRYHVVEQSKELIRKIGWHGVGMIEFKVHEGNAYIMELNGRFWGSIELGLFAGMELPYWQIAYNYENTMLPSQIVSCTKEVFARNFRNDLLNVLKAKSIKRVGIWMKTIPGMLRKKDKIEDNLFADPVFRLLTWTELAGKFIGNKWSSVKRIFSSGKHAVNSQGINLKSAIFICEGNICRSPFAEKYLKAARPELSITSCGMQFQSSKMSPLNAVEAARKFDVDVSLHLSRYIGDADLNNPDMIFIMDKINHQKIRRTYPQIMDKVFLLDENGGIADPYGKEFNDYIQCYTKIKANIDRVFCIE